MTPILFCADPLKPREVDEAFEQEALAARAAGFPIMLLDYEAVVSGDVERAVKRLPRAPRETPTLYRGWMMKNGPYHWIWSALKERGYSLVNNAEDYEKAHYYPRAFSYFKDHTVEAVWMGGSDLGMAWSLTGTLRPGPILVKDWVKSEKHYWDTACFIPDSTNREHFEKVCTEFLRLREGFLEQGLVFRRYVDLKKTAEGKVDERRLFFFERELVAGNASLLAEVPFLRQVVHDMPSHFFSIDLAQKDDGSWIVVETGDGGVSSIPALVTPDQFYRSLASRCRVLESQWNQIRT